MESYSKELKKIKQNLFLLTQSIFLCGMVKGFKSKNIEKIYITASGGPFNYTPLNHFKNITIQNALKHPNWKMGKNLN